jgi:hypothetical protein
MNKILDFFNRISGLMVFLILLIVFITHFQLAHRHHRPWDRRHGHDLRHKRDSADGSMKSDTSKIK